MDSYFVKLSLFVLCVTLVSCSHEQKVQQNDFIACYKNQLVSEVIILANENKVEFRLDNDKLVQANLTAQYEGNVPYVFSIASDEAFILLMKDLDRDISEEARIGYEVEYRSGLSSILVNWGLLFLLILIPVGIPIVLILGMRRKIKVLERRIENLERA